MANNPCAKTVTPDQAYEVWQSLPGLDEVWTYYVLKKYQTPEREAQNPNARWYCYVTSPIMPNGEYGDVYVSEVMRGTVKLDHNPLTHQDEQTTGETHETT